MQTCEHRVCQKTKRAVFVKHPVVYLHYTILGCIGGQSSAPLYTIMNESRCSGPPSLDLVDIVDKTHLPGSVS